MTVCPFFKQVNKYCFEHKIIKLTTLLFLVNGSSPNNILTTLKPILRKKHGKYARTRCSQFLLLLCNQILWHEFFHMLSAEKKRTF